MYVKAKAIYSLVSVDFNEISPLVQHSHSRYRITTSNMSNRLRINLKCTYSCSNGRPLEGAMYINLSWKNSRGASRKWKKKKKIISNFSKYPWFQTKQFTRLLEFIKLYKQNPLEIFFFFFTILVFTQNYTVATQDVNA